MPQPRTEVVSGMFPAPVSPAVASPMSAKNPTTTAPATPSVTAVQVVENRYWSNREMLPLETWNVAPRASYLVPRRGYSHLAHTPKVSPVVSATIPSIVATSSKVNSPRGTLRGCARWTRTSVLGPGSRARARGAGGGEAGCGNVVEARGEVGRQQEGCARRQHGSTEDRRYWHA